MQVLPSLPSGELNPAWGLAAFVDVETTGFRPQVDEIVEVAALLFAFTRDTYEIMGVVDRYVGRQEPSVEMMSLALKVHGLTLSDLRGQKLDLVALQRILEQAEILIAHNAQFDRSFLRQVLPQADALRWLCSLRGINWTGYGFESRRLRHLAAEHGLQQPGEFHRADDDCMLAINLLAQTGTEHTYLYELVHQAEIAKQRRMNVSRQSPRRQSAQERAAARPADGPLSGQTVVVTGGMNRWTREEIEDLIESLGGHASGSVSKRTTLVVAGPGAGSKLTKATELGIRVVNEDEFLQLIVCGE